MNDFLKGLQDVFIARMNNLFFINFIIAWCIVNYDTFLLMLFDDMSINEKIVYLHYFKFDYIHTFLFPFLLTFLYIFALPVINLMISRLYNKYINNEIVKHKNDLLKNHYTGLKDIEEVKLKSTTFVQREIENNMNQQGLEIEKNRLANAESLNAENAKKNTLKEEELKLNEEYLASLRKTNGYEELLNKINILEDLIGDINTGTGVLSPEIKYITNYTDEGLALIADITDRLLNPSVYIVLPTEVLHKPLKIPSLQYKENKYLSLDNLHSLFDKQFIPTNVIDERFIVVRYRFTNEELDLFKSVLSDFGYKEITTNIDKIEQSKLIGNEYLLMSEKEFRKDYETLRGIGEKNSTYILN